MRDNGLEPGPMVEEDFTIEGGYRGMCRLLEQDATFTAAFIGNDHMAIGARTALANHGLRVPEDVSIVGFDDLSESAHMLPGLTTVRQDFAMLGQLATEY
jgi:DNA-binding LacI/PurR family transcriptional regulator